MGKGRRRPFDRYRKTAAASSTAKKLCRLAREWPETTSVERGEAIPLSQRQYQQVQLAQKTDHLIIKVIGKESVQEIRVFTREPEIIRRKAVIACRCELHIPFSVEA